MLAVPAHGQVYISAAGNHEVAIVDDKTLKVAARVGDIRFPDGIAYASGADKVFVSDEAGSADVVIDPTTRAKRSTIALGGEAGNTHYDSVSGCILVAVQTKNELVAIDPVSERIVQRYSLPGSDHPHGFVIDETDRLAFVSCEGNAALIVVDLRTMKPVQHARGRRGSRRSRVGSGVATPLRGVRVRRAIGVLARRWDASARRRGPSAARTHRFRRPEDASRLPAARERRRASGASSLPTRGVTKSVSSAHFVGLSLAAAVAFNGASAQDTLSRARGAAEPRPGYVIRRTTEPIRLDASLGEAIWGLADSVTVFRQREPAEGEAASERTVFKAIRDADRLYVAVRAYDRDMRSVRSAQLRRDADLTTDDYITLLIDSYRDRRGAFLFRTNANGAMWDAQLVGLDNLNENWNGIWDVATRRDERSWTAEFAIPLRTLRFNPSRGVIGMNVQRFIRRKNEEDLWQSWGRAQGIDNLLYTADVAGLDDVGQTRPVEVRPYVLARTLEPSYDASGPRVAPGGSGGRVGVDAKVGATPTVTADLTLNTDFAQVEADQQVINLTRFPTFFPEKREFFLESSGLFDIGTAERVQLFYSRRLGLDSTGAAVPILGGARVYGKQGPWAIGLLDVRTGGGENANDVAVRVGRDIFDRSTAAGMFVDRSAPGACPSEAVDSTWISRSSCAGTTWSRTCG